MKALFNNSLQSTHGVICIISITALCAMGYGLWQNASQPVYAKHGERANPWRGLPGCLWVGTGVEKRLWPVTKNDTLACGLELGRTPNALSIDEIPQYSGALLNSLQPWLAAPPQGNPNAVTAAVVNPQFPYRIQALGKRPVQQGHSIHLSLDLDAQKQAQKIANCMTGNLDDCAEAGVPASRWQHHFEKAGARMAAVIQVDLQTGGVDAMVSAFSPCYVADANGKPAIGCPDLAHAGKKPELWRLENQALYAYERLGSLVKPLEVLTLLNSNSAQRYNGPKGAAWVKQVLKKSDTQALLDELFCKDTGFSADCKRLLQISTDAQSLELSGEAIHPLFGNTLGFSLPGARAFSELATDGSGKKAWRSMQFEATSPALRAECSARGWRQCRSEALANQVAELLGEGSTGGSPLGVAHMLNVLGAAANGSIEGNRASMYTPRLAHKLVTGSNKRLEDLFPPPISSEAAHLITQGMALSHTSGGGTAHSACLAVLGDAKACNSITNLAGKTGTPGFRHKLLTWPQRSALCSAATEEKKQALAQGVRVPGSVLSTLASCTHAPVKWYAALVKTSTKPNAPYTKAVVVLAERNWVQSTGLVDSPEDRVTPNIAAELAMRYLKNSGLIGNKAVAVGAKP